MRSIISRSLKFLGNHIYDILLLVLVLSILFIDKLSYDSRQDRIDNTLIEYLQKENSTLKDSISNINTRLKDVKTQYVKDSIIFRNRSFSDDSLFFWNYLRQQK